jgi:hypothetical protein
MNTYRCQAAVEARGLDRHWTLGVHHTASPRLALRWLRDHALHIADALTADPATDYLRTWAADWDAHATHLTDLATGRPITVRVPAADRLVDGRRIDVCYTLTAHRSPR